MKEYVVFDLEWNQSADGRQGRVEHLPFEIIEIGAVKLDGQLNMVSEFHRLIRPQVYTQMHYMIAEVTHLNMEVLQAKGQDFPAVIQAFLDWCGEDAIFCTWGSMDLTELQRNMAHYQLNVPWQMPVLYYDVQKLYSLIFEDGKLKSSLEVAAEELEIVPDRPFHRALDDAYYTGKIMKAMGIDQVKEYYSMDYYHLPECREDEIYLAFPNYSKYVSRLFPGREEALQDRSVTEVRCNICGRCLRKKVRWFTSNQKIYFALASCPEHGYVKAKIRIKKAEGGETFIIRTSKMTDEQGAMEVRLKREDARKKRDMKKKMPKK